MGRVVAVAVGKAWSGGSRPLARGVERLLGVVRCAHVALLGVVDAPERGTAAPQWRSSSGVDWRRLVSWPCRLPSEVERVVAQSSRRLLSRCSSSAVARSSCRSGHLVRSAESNVSSVQQGVVPLELNPRRLASVAAL